MVGVVFLPPTHSFAIGNAYPAAQEQLEMDQTGLPSKLKLVSPHALKLTRCFSSRLASSVSRFFRRDQDLS